MITNSFFGVLLVGLLSCSSALVVGCGDSGATGAGGGGNGGGGAGGNGTGAGVGQPAAAALYGPAIKTIVIEVDYATGAEPYTGPMVGMGDTWDLFEKNAVALFEGGDKTLVVPHTLAEMEELTDVPDQDFDTDDILALAAKHRTEASTADEAALYLLWLPAYYKDKDGVQKNVLGVSLWDTGVIAMFKPVIASGGGGPLVSHFVEQTTLIHEFGHAAGLVNNGIAMASPHQDEAHGAHCSNQDCVMYYLNEGASDMLLFVQNSIAKGDTDLFGTECLDDAHAATAAAAP